MKKKVYVKPSVSVCEMEAEPILAGSKGIGATIDNDDTPLDYGGDTQDTIMYNPW